MNILSCMGNIKETENGAVVYSTSGQKVVDLFGLAGAMRGRNIVDKQTLFYDALIENPDLAIKTIFYIRDCRGGQGERDFFRKAYLTLINYNIDIAIANMENILYYGRIDDLIDIAYHTDNKQFKDKTIEFVRHCLNEDFKAMEKKQSISLLAKWLPSINASNKETIAKGRWLRQCLNMKESSYRKALSKLRAYLNIVEKNISNKDYDNIVYEQVPSQCMRRLRNAFHRNDLLRFSEYIENVKSGQAKINTKTNYPYEMIKPYLEQCYYHHKISKDMYDEVLETMWKNLPDYIKGEKLSIVPVVDTSGSMEGLPMEVAVSLGIYISERMNGPFKDKFITFSERPNMIDISDCNTLLDKTNKVVQSNWGMNTDIVKVFKLMLNTAVSYNLKQEDFPKQLLIITDMEFDSGATCYSNQLGTLFDNIKKEYTNHGYKLPKIVWWNVDARQNTFPMTSDDNCIYVSGCSPSIMEAVIRGENLSPLDFVKSVVLNDRYKRVITK